jgi:uncharacterized protein (DUF1501 family)
MNNLSTPYLPTTRRDFLRVTGSGLGLLAFSAFAPNFLARAALANVPAPQRDRRILVIIQLAGGNDGLNTVVPYADDLYYKLRPRLGIKDQSTLTKLDDHVALPASCAPLAGLFKDGKFAIVQNVGYPNPNHSHFRSSEIWETGSDADTYLPTGWVGRYLDNCCAGKPADNPTTDQDPVAVHGGTMMPETFQADLPQRYFGIGNPTRANLRFRPRRDHAQPVPLLEEFAQAPAQGDTVHFLNHTLMDTLVTERRVQNILDAYNTPVNYPGAQLAQSLKRVAALVSAGLETRVYFCSQGSYDTHANQFDNHQRLLGDLSNSLAAFQKDLERQGLDKQVLTMTFSEFGRRPNENAAQGTDHGTAAPLFMMGTALKVKGGLLGDAPNLNIPDKADLEYKIDFRQVYATVLRQWLDADPTALLGKKFEELPILA